MTPNPRRAPQDLVVFDTETTGIPPGARLVEIGAVKVKGNHIVDRFEKLIWPECPIPEEVVRIHGIDDEAVSKAATADVVLEKFFSWIGPLPLLGHNVSFDARMVAGEAERFQMTLPDNPVLCTLRAARKVLKRKSNSLVNLVQDLGLPSSRHHRALDDAEHTLQLYWKIQAIVGTECNWSSLGGGPALSSHLPEVPRLPASRAILQIAASEGTPLDLQYRTSSGNLIPLRVTPRWFWTGKYSTMMEALCHHDYFYKSYRLDRIVAASSAEDAFDAQPRRFC